MYIQAYIQVYVRVCQVWNVFILSTCVNSVPRSTIYHRVTIIYFVASLLETLTMTLKISDFC